MRLRQPRERRDHRRLARLPDFLRLEGLGHDRQGRARAAGTSRSSCASRAAPSLPSIDFGLLHPGGKLGTLLKTVRDIMHTGAAVPLSPLGTRMSEAILEMTAKGFGCVGITDPRGLLVGIITDGDLRRHMRDNLLDARVEDVMTRGAKTVRPDQLLSETLDILNSMKVTALFAVEGGKPVGVIHVHDLLRAGTA